MSRYLIKGQRVQTLSMDVDSEHVLLPSPASTPSNQSKETDVRDSGDPDDQLHL